MTFDLSAENRETIRTLIDGWVICTGNNPTVLHIPQDTDSDSAQPSCLTGLGNGIYSGSEWYQKPTGAYPVGYHDLCQRCLERKARVDERFAEVLEG